MSVPAIRVERLSKRYQVSASKRPETLRDAVSSKAARLLRTIGPRSQSDSPETNDFWALRDVSFEIASGDVLGIIGRNGAGKSTLLKILSRITLPTSGRATLQGRVASLLEVGTGFHPELTGRENVYLNGAVLGLTRAEIRARFDEIVTFAEVERFLDTPVKRYSSGMQMRLAFAVAAHLEPEILIVDEVLAVGDLAFQKKCMGKMGTISRQEGRTVLFVSHNLSAVRQLCRSALLLSHGTVEAQGSVESVLGRYMNASAPAELATCPPPSPEQRERAYATAVLLEEITGRAATELAVGQPWQVRLRVRVARPLESVVMAVGVVAIDGTPIQTAWSQPADLEPGEHEMLFIQDRVILEAGSYTFRIGITERDHKVQQFDCGRLEITSERSVGTFPVTSGAGCVLNSMTVHRLGPS